MIKVGDLYTDTTKMTHNILITFVSRDSINCLAANGGMFTIGNNAIEKADFLRNRVRIKEFSNWKDAITSEEFNNETN